MIEALLWSDASEIILQAAVTGSPLGDPIEIAAVVDSMCTQSRFLYCESIKASIGHMEPPSGSASAVTLLGSMVQQVVSRCAQLHSLNPNLRSCVCEHTFIPNSESAPQPPNRQRLCGRVSSFGFSGTIVHAAIASPLHGLQMHCLGGMVSSFYRDVVRDTDTPHFQVCLETPNNME